jgi:3-deoxy-D-manno-octulosonic-acid transferase
MISGPDHCRKPFTIMTADKGLALRAYLAASHLIPVLARVVLPRRLRKGKEDPARWREKQALGLPQRPQGRLVWINAVGLGEVLSLRGLIARMADAAPDLHFLVTSTTRASAQVFAAQLPPRTQHLFLPLDAPRWRRRFLAQVRPDLVIWAEQDLWPGFVHDIARLHIPQAMVATRMDAQSFARHARLRGLYRDLYARMARIVAQDAATSAHLAALGAKPSLGASLKPAAPPLAHDPAALDALHDRLAGRFVWASAPSHPADEAQAIAANRILQSQGLHPLLIIAPRHPDRRAAIAAACPVPPPQKSSATLPGPDDPIWLADTFGDLGLIYRAAKAVLIGGSFDATEGHNPWEAALLDCALLHGPRMGNFTPDLAALHQAGGAIAVQDAASIATALMRPDLAQVAQNARAAAQKAAKATDALALDMLSLLKPRHD